MSMQTSKLYEISNPKIKPSSPSSLTTMQDIGYFQTSPCSNDHNRPHPPHISFSCVLYFSSTLAPVTYTLTIFNLVLNPSVFLPLVSSHTREDHVQVALSIHSCIPTYSSVKSNNYTYPSLFKAFGSHQWLKDGKSLHVHVLKILSSPIDKLIQASLVNIYSRCGKVGLARYIFNRILTTWNSMPAYARNDAFSLVDNIHGNTGFLWRF